MTYLCLRLIRGSLLWSTKTGHWFRFIRPVIRFQLAFCIRYSCVVVDGCSSATHQPQLALGWHSHAPAHALPDTIAPEHLAELNAGVVTTLVEVKHQLLRAASGLVGHT